MRGGRVSANEDRDGPTTAGHIKMTTKFGRMKRGFMTKLNKLKTLFKVSKGGQQRLDAQGAKLTASTESLVDSGASDHFVGPKGALINEREATSAQASSAVGGTTRLDSKAVTTMFLQSTEDGIWFPYTTGRQEGQKSFIYHGDTFAHGILSFAKLLENPDVKLGQYRDGQMVIELEDDDGIKRRVKLYDKGSLLWLTSAMVDKQVKCNRLRCDYLNCPTRRRCEKCNLHLPKNTITPNASTDIGVISLKSREVSSIARANELCSRKGFEISQLNTRRLTFNQKLLMGKSATATKWLKTVNATGVKEGEVELLNFLQLIHSPPILTPEGTVHEHVLNSMSVSEQQAYRETGSTTEENITVVNACGLDELQRAIPSELTEIRERMDINEREVKALKRAEERHKDAERKASEAHSKDRVQREKLVQELRKRIGTPRRGLRHAMIAARQYDEALFHSKLMHTSKARTRRTMDNLPGVIRRENKLWFKKLCVCCLQGDRRHTGGPQGMIRLRTEADKRAALEIEIADMDTYRELLDKQLVRLQDPANEIERTPDGLDVNQLKLQVKEFRRRRLALGEKERDTSCRPVLNKIDGVASAQMRTRTRFLIKCQCADDVKAASRPKKFKVKGITATNVSASKGTTDVKISLLRKRTRQSTRQVTVKLNLAESDRARLSECNDRWDQLPTSKRLRHRPNSESVGFEPNQEELKEDTKAAVNGFTTVRNGTITAAPPTSKLRKLNTIVNSTAIESLLDMDSIATPRAVMNMRIVSYVDWSPKSVKWLGGVRYLLRMVVPELKMVWTTYHINKGAADAISGSHELLDYMASKTGAVSVIRSDADCFASPAYKTAMAARGVDVEVHGAKDAKGTGPVERYNGIINDLVTKSLLNAACPEILAQAYDRQANLILCTYLIGDGEVSPPAAALTGRHILPTHLFVMGSEVYYLDANRDAGKSKQASPRLLGHYFGEMATHAGIHIFDPVAGKLQHKSPRSYRVKELTSMRSEIPAEWMPYAKATNSADWQAMNFNFCTSFNAYSRGLIKFDDLSADEQRKELSRRTKKREQSTAATTKLAKKRTATAPPPQFELIPETKEVDGNVAEMNESVDPKTLIGATIQRYFPECGRIEGTVLSFHVRKNQPTWYKVRHSDGDEEELTLRQLLKYELDVNAQINGAETNAIQATVNVIQLEYDESSSEDDDQMNFEGSGEPDGDSRINKFDSYDSPDLFQDVSQKYLLKLRTSTANEARTHPPRKRAARRRFKMLETRSRGRDSPVQSNKAQTRPPDESDFIKRKRQRRSPFAQREKGYRRKVISDWSRVQKINYLKTVEFDSQLNSITNITDLREADERGSSVNGENVGTTSSKSRYRCELDFREDEEPEWLSDDAAVIGEAMITERGRILSVINKSQLHKSLNHGHQIQVNLSKAKSRHYTVDEYNPTAKHVLDPEHPKHDDWVASMMKEINGLTETGVIEGEYLKDVPKNERATILHSKLVFKLKVNPTTGEESCKCRLVVRGDRAQAGLHYPEGMDCPGSSMSSLKLMCARSVHTRSVMRSFDIAMAYTQSKAPVGYNNRIMTPPGVPKITNADGDEICYKLISNLYGGPASGAIHWESVKKMAESTGLASSLNDRTLFSRNANEHERFHYFSIYVDDGLSYSQPTGWHDSFMNTVRKRFKLGLEEVTQDMLGCAVIQAQYDTKKKRRTEVKPGENFVVLSNEEAIKRIVLSTPVGNGNYYPRSTPVDVDLGARIDDTLPDFISNYLIKTERELSPQEEQDYKQMIKDYEYKSLVPCLAYYARLTRPDLSYVIACMQRHLHATVPSYDAYRALRQTLQYLLGTASMNMIFHEQGSKLVDHFVDANFPIGRARMGYCCTYAGASIDHHCKLSSCVATSSTEAEIYAACAGLQKASCLKHDFEALGVYGKDEKMRFWEDNDAALLNVKGEVKLTTVSRMKHIGSKYLKILESGATESENQTSEWFRVETKLNLSDFFTKALSKGPYEKFRDVLMGRVWLPRILGKEVKETESLLAQVRRASEQEPMSVKRIVADQAEKATELKAPTTINETATKGSRKITLRSRLKKPARGIKLQRNCEGEIGTLGKKRKNDSREIAANNFFCFNEA